MNVIGVDPGLEGGLAFFVNGSLREVLPMPVIEKIGKSKTYIDKHNNIKKTHEVHRQVDEDRVAEMLRVWKRVSLEQKVELNMFIERVGSMPQQGLVSTFNFGFGTGKLWGIAAAYLIPRRTVEPVTWKKAMGCTSDKATSRAAATQWMPTHWEHFTKKADSHAGKSEAALIGLYGYRIAK